MSSNNKKQDNQIQLRIDSKTKKQAQKILEAMGLDISTAIKMMLKQVVITGNMPLELRDANGFTLKKSLELKEAILESKNSEEYENSDELIKSLA
jgi:DNA-damage-inducible protein J